MDMGLPQRASDPTRPDIPSSYPKKETLPRLWRTEYIIMIWSAPVPVSVWLLEIGLEKTNAAANPDIDDVPDLWSIGSNEQKNRIG